MAAATKKDRMVMTGRYADRNGMETPSQTSSTVSGEDPTLIRVLGRIRLLRPSSDLADQLY